MNKKASRLTVILFLLLGLTGCGATEAKSDNLTVIYGIATIVSALILIGYLCFFRNKNSWFILLFASVLVVNIGYTALSASTCLENALFANRIAYLGSVTLPMSMLMIIIGITNTKHPKWLPVVLLGLAGVVFLIAASPGILDIYYKEVTFEIINGSAKLIKVYGTLHFIYLLYLLGYFAAMVGVIIFAFVKEAIDTTTHAILIAVATVVNIGVWLIEQFINLNFELLSVSYIISELFLLGVHLVMSENQRLRNQVNLQKPMPVPCREAELPSPLIDPDFTHAAQLFISGMDTLTPKERTLFDAYVAGHSTKEIMADMNIKENTLKFHNKNLYSKLGVSSRKQLILIHRKISNQSL